MIISGFANASGNGGTWMRHPSFYQQTQQLVDGERLSYFLLHQQPFHATSYPDFKHNTATLFRVDKTDPSGNIKALSELYPAFPVIIRTITYSPSQKMLAAVADDGSVWFLPDGGEPFSLSSTLVTGLPGRPRVNSITENPEDGTFWIGATYGYFQADPKSGKFLKSVRTEYPVEWIVESGGELIIISGGQVFSAGKEDFPFSLESLSPLKIENVSTAPAHLFDNGVLKEVSNLMPLTAKTFAFFGPRSSSSAGNTVAIASKGNSGWSVISIGEGEMRNLGKDKSTTLLTANNAIPNKEGYYIHSQNSAHQLIRGIEPDISDPEGYSKKVMRTIMKTEDAKKESISWDFERFIFFTPKEGFYTRTFDGSWSVPSPKVWPDAPAPFTPFFMTWHPQLGMLFSQHGLDTHRNENSPSIPWLLSAYKDGKWTQLSPVFHITEEMITNEEAAKILNSNIESFPLHLPLGLAMDPENKYAYAGSRSSGWARINLNNPAELPLHVGSSKNAYMDTPGFIEGFPVFSGWPSLCNVSAPHFDSEGRLWFLFMDFDKTFSSDHIITLCYYTPEDLKAMERANLDKSLYREPHKIELKGADNVSAIEDLVTLQYPGHENIIAFHSGKFGSPLYLYDHNGTPENTADDRFAVLTALHDSYSRSPVTPGTPLALWEDPATGEIWMSTNKGTFLTDPAKAFEDPENAVSFFRTEEENGKSEKYFEAAEITGGVQDSMGNLWVSSKNSGIYLISADRKKVLEHYNSANSPITSNRVYNLAFNPESMSLFLSTADGIIEFFPDILSTGVDGSGSMYPSNITPDFAGWVTVTSLSDKKEYQITDLKGRNVKTLGKPSGGILQWSVGLPGDEDLPTGIYILTDSDSIEIHRFHVVRN